MSSSSPETPTLRELAKPTRLTASLPGTGGVIKLEPGDFEVEELPAYEPSGDGEHLFLWVQKTNTSAFELSRYLAKTLQISTGDIGTAGLKDTRAVTRQYVSVPARAEQHLEQVESEQIEVLWARRHHHKLRTGHLRGNRFRVLLREVATDALQRAEAVVAELRERGMPNFYGPQRFGAQGSTLEQGLALLCNQEAAKQRRGKSSFRRLALSAVQSALFNAYLNERMRDGLLHTALDGEVMLVCASGGPFVVTDQKREQSRFDAHEIVPAGPMFGPKMRRARDTSLEREQRILAGAGLSEDAFEIHRKLTRGTRRPTLVWLNDLEVSRCANGLELTFTLPAGAYATVLLDEVTKNGTRASCQ